jgi:hypothetical protein
LRRKKRRNEDDVVVVQNGISPFFPNTTHISISCGELVEKALHDPSDAIKTLYFKVILEKLGAHYPQDALPVAAGTGFAPKRVTSWCTVGYLSGG